AERAAPGGQRHGSSHDPFAATAHRHARGDRRRARAAGRAARMSHEFDPDRPVDPRDYTRRTLLANERTYLAWWRTGITSVAAALAAARVVPELSDVKHR